MKAFSPLRAVILSIAALALALATATATASAAEVAVRQIQPGSYELVLTNPTALGEDEAHAHIAQAASSVCKDAGVVLGKWKYASNEAVGRAASSSAREGETFRFVQEVTCVPGAPSVQPAKTGERKPMLGSEEEKQQVQSEIKRKSETYFRLIAAKRLDEAVTQVAIASIGVDEARWKRDKTSFQAVAGEPVQITIAKLTVYDNPANAPQPGLYVAADYSNVYRGVPVHCGYLMWYRPVGGEFQILREETGHITAEQMKSISVMQMPDIKRKLRCPVL